MTPPRIVKWQLSLSEVCDASGMGTRIQRRRVELGHTIESLALASGLTDDAVRAIERGEDCGVTWRALACLLSTLRVELQTWVRP